jgi:hypothetical protein
MKFSISLGQLFSADRTRVMVLKPGLDAARVKTVTTWQKHSFLSNLKLFETDVAGWSL